MFLVTDVMNAEVLQANCDEIMAKYGRVDALLNAAGGNMPGATIAPTGNFFDRRDRGLQDCAQSQLDRHGASHPDFPAPDGRGR